MPAHVWAALAQVWHWEVGDFDSVAVASRGEADPLLRVLLLQDGEPTALAKAAPVGAADLIESDEASLRLLTSARPHGFRIPRVLASGTAEEWRYLLTRPLPPRIHSMPLAPALGRIVGEIHMGLSSLPRPGSVPGHWHPMHGELAPWTVRELPDGEIVILDWEHASWAPPGADEVYYRAAHSALMGEAPGPIHVREAVEFWRRRLREPRAVGYRGPEFTKQLLRALDRMASEGRMGGGAL